MSPEAVLPRIRGFVRQGSGLQCELGLSFVALWPEEILVKRTLDLLIGKPTSLECRNEEKSI